MAAFYADEDIPAALVNALVSLGHDVLTVAADGRANQRIADSEVLARAAAIERAVLTFNRWDLHRLHSVSAAHAGIVTCTNDPDRVALAHRIHLAVSAEQTLTGKLIKIIRPSGR